jgi:chorismate mutase
VTRAEFELLGELVLDDDELLQRLLALTDRNAFAAAVAQVAASHGLSIGPAEVEAALVAARRAWLERWI